MKRTLPVILLLLLAACKQELPKMPDDILPLDKMTVIMADMHMADAVAETKAQAGENEQALTATYYARIYQLNGVTAEQVVKSRQFYKENPAWMDKLYDEVLTELSKRNASVSK